MAETKINANQTTITASDIGAASTAQLANKQDIMQYSTMPTAGETNVNKVVQYTGETTSSYTKGYFYKCIEHQNPGTATAAKSASSITSVSVNASRFMEKMAYYFPNHNISGANVFQWSSDSWCFKLLPENLDVNMFVEEGGVFLEGIKVLGVTYTPDYASFSEGDTITITYTPAPSTYTWETSPTGAGIENLGAASRNNLTIVGTPNPSTGFNDLINIGYGSSCAQQSSIAIGNSAQTQTSDSWNTVVIGHRATTTKGSTVVIGDNAHATGPSSVIIGGGAQTVNVGANASSGVAIGGSAQISCGDGTVIGTSAQCGGGLLDAGISIGKYSNAEGVNLDRAIAIGPYSYASDGLAIGHGMSVGANYAIQMGMTGSSSSKVTNSDANTFKVANVNGNFEIMSADGTIPEARLASTTSAQEGDTLTLNSSGNAVWTNPLQYVLGGLQTTDSSKVGYLQYYFEENNAVSAPAGGRWLVLDCLKANNSSGVVYLLSADVTSPVGSIVAGGTQIAAARSGYTTRALLLKVE